MLVLLGTGSIAVAFYRHTEYRFVIVCDSVGEANAVIKFMLGREEEIENAEFNGKRFKKKGKGNKLDGKKKGDL